MEQQPPMGDANLVPPQGQAPMPSPNETTANIPQAQPGSEPIPTGEPYEEPMMGNEQQENPDSERKEIEKNIGKACTDFRGYQGQDKDDLAKWIEGMLDSITDDVDGAGIEDEQPEEQPEQEPQMESVIFKKAQLTKLNEVLANMEQEKEEKPQEKEKKLKKNNSPFNNPDFTK